MRLFQTLTLLWKNAIKSFFCVLIALSIVSLFKKFGFALFNGIVAFEVDDFITTSNFNIVFLLPMGIFFLSPWKNFYNLENTLPIIQIVTRTMFHSAIVEIFYIIALAILTADYSGQGLVTNFKDSIIVVIFANLLSFAKFKTS